MDLDFPAKAEAFRTDVREFLRQELPSWWTNFLADDDRVIPFITEFCQKLGEKGWLTMHWPEEYGGSSVDDFHQSVIREEMWGAGEPRGWQYMSSNYIGPTIIEYGTTAQKERYLKPISEGRVFWCQGFTEPHTGSDLAAVKTRAEDTGSSFKLNGKKAWISYADDADHCFLMTRTDPDSSRHAGLSMLIVDMNTPGITVRPVKAMAGGRIYYNEIHFEDAEVPHDALLGPLNKGWEVAMWALGRERIGLAYSGRNTTHLQETLAYVKSAKDASGRPLSESSDVRSRLIRLRAKNRALRLFMHKVVATPAGDTSIPTNSAIYKVLAGDSTLETGQLAMDVAGQRGLLSQVDPLSVMGEGPFMAWAHAMPVQIAAGSSEIQRNIIAQLGLGLPRG